MPITVLSYLLTDVGGRTAKVNSKQHRLLAGLRGEEFGWTWESAMVYSDASAEDIAQSPVSSLWQQSLSRTTADPYNPFNGGDLAAPHLADGTPSNDLTSFMQDARRYGRSSLGMIDFKMSRPDLFALPAGDVGVAMGVEVRWETSEDDRERTGDFSTPYVDPVTGISYVGDSMGASAAWDVKGNRTVHHREHAARDP